MRKIDIDKILSEIKENNPDEYNKFETWNVAANKARDKVFEILKESKDIRLDEIDFKLNSQIWSDLKKWMLKNITFNKCAYCEKILTTDEKETIYYDAEHFRPKGKVTLKSSEVDVDTYDEFGEKIKHPGYFWIAYDYKNLLPSCKVCNSGNGKQCQYPIKKQYQILKKCSEKDKKDLLGNCIESPRRKGYYFLSVEELNKIEEPLLLNPYFDDISNFIKFIDDGLISPGEPKEKGDNTINILHLDREDLVTGRMNAQVNISDYVDDYHKAVKYEENQRKNIRLTILKELKRLALNGEGEYSAYSIFYLNTFHTKIYEMVKNI